MPTITVCSSCQNLLYIPLCTIISVCVPSVFCFYSLEWITRRHQGDHYTLDAFKCRLKAHLTSLTAQNFYYLCPPSLHLRFDSAEDHCARYKYFHSTAIVVGWWRWRRCYWSTYSVSELLLRNAAEFVDKLMEIDEHLCAHWSCPELVLAIMEAVKQIGYSTALMSIGWLVYVVTDVWGDYWEIISPKLEILPDAEGGG